MSRTDRPYTALAGQYLTFVLNQQAYGVPIGTVREINRLGAISFVPQVPAFVAGVINLRGKVVPVVDLCMLFGFPESPRTKETCVIVIEGESGQVGTIVDRVAGVIELDASHIEPAPDVGDITQASFVIGMGKSDDRLIILVDTVQALTGQHLATLKLIQQNKAAA